MKLSLSLFLALFGVATAGVQGEDPCMAGEVTINSRVLQGQVVLYEQVKNRPASGALVEVFVLQNDEWRLYSRVIPVNRGARFTLLEVDPGKYYLLAQADGFKTSKVYLNVKRGVAKKEIVIPLTNGTCLNAKVQKAR